MAVESAWLREVDQRRRAWLAYLADTSELLGQSLDVELTVAVVPQVVVPRLGAWCAVHLVDDGGPAPAGRPHPRRRGAAPRAARGARRPGPVARAARRAGRAARRDARPGPVRAADRRRRRAAHLARQPRGGR